MSFTDPEKLLWVWKGFVYPFFICKENSRCASLSAPRLLCVHLWEKGLLWPVAVPVLWMGTKALISIHLCFTVAFFLEYPYPMVCAFCHFKCGATCSLKGLVFSRRACWCQWLTVVSAGGVVPSTSEVSALQGNLLSSDPLGLSACRKGSWHSSAQQICNDFRNCWSGWKTSLDCFPLFFMLCP